MPSPLWVTSQSSSDEKRDFTMAELDSEASVWRYVPVRRLPLFVVSRGASQGGCANRFTTSRSRI